MSSTRNHALTGEGNIDARIMFVGVSGQVFNSLLLAAGIDRNLVFMTNLVKCMMPKNRKPKMSEIEVIQVEVIVPLGYYSAQKILQKLKPLCKMTDGC